MKYDAPKEFIILSTIPISLGDYSTHPKGRVAYSKVSFVVAESFVLRINPPVGGW